MKLFSYFRSSAAFRLRIGLKLKGLDYQYIAVNLLAGEQKNDAYTDLNPQGLVPALEVAEGEILGQSVALLEWLEETHPQPTLLPESPLQRARVRSLVNSIACDVHPLCNSGVTQYLSQQHGAGAPELFNWYRQWMHRGFGAAETTLARNNSSFAFGEQPGMADIVLVPQVYNARRFNIPLGDFPHLTRVVDHCMTLSAFAEAAPENQPDCPDQSAAP